ncbi:MAG: hypothetical protein CL760_10210 [Chloroflexi bacterium]|nr:hypothetical protein [Chloroflexota bacterium]|tara:strand:- start:15176 stop:15763 length:588 start_codon:yes stop_codon:yes gene_type:complete
MNNFKESLEFKKINELMKETRGFFYYKFNKRLKVWNLIVAAFLSISFISVSSLMVYYDLEIDKVIIVSSYIIAICSQIILNIPFFIVVTLRTIYLIIRNDFNKDYRKNQKIRDEIGYILSCSNSEKIFDILNYFNKKDYSYFHEKYISQAIDILNKKNIKHKNNLSKQEFLFVLNKNGLEQKEEIKEKNTEIINE